jgi:hypothetical protein
MAEDPKVLRGDEAIAEFHRQLGLLSAASRDAPPPPPELCDHCNEPTSGYRHMIMTTVRSHTVDESGRAVHARVNTQRWWRFCSEACAHAWYATDTDEHYLPMGPAPEVPPCEAHPEGIHDFPAAEAPEQGPAITVKDGQFRIEHADGTLEEGDYIPGMHLAASGPPIVCRHCDKDAAEVMPSAPHLISEGEHRDRLFRMVAVHVVPSAEAPVTLLDHQIFDEAHELNTYWTSPGAPTPLGPSGEPATIPAAAPAEEEPS